MKLAILHSGDLRGVSPGGVDRYIKSLILGLKSGEVTLFGTTKSESGCVLGRMYEAEYEGKSYRFVPIAYDDKRPLSVNYARCIRRYFGELETFDCIYAQRIEFTLPFAFSPLRKKVFQIIHGSSAYSKIGFGKAIALVYPFFEKLAIRIAFRTYVILNRDEFGVPYYKRMYPSLSDKIFYARNPIDYGFYSKAIDSDDFRHSMGIDRDSRVVTYLGRVVDNPKRVLLLPDVCRRVKDECEDVVFLIVGDGGDLEKLRRRANEFNVGESFVFAGYVSDSETIRKCLSLSDITINLSCFEGTCTSILESLASKTPVVATDVGDINECASNGRNGIVIPNSNSNDAIVENAATAIVKLLHCPVKVDDVAESYDLNRVGEWLTAEIKSIDVNG